MPFIVAVDLDGMLLAFPDFFTLLFPAFQSGGSKVGILSGRPETEQDAITQALEKFGIHPDFVILKPDALAAFSNGMFKAAVCNELGVNLLFDDFQASDPRMVSDFFSLNTQTIPMTSWDYQP